MKEKKERERERDSRDVLYIHSSPARANFNFISLDVDPSDYGEEAADNEREEEKRREREEDTRKKVKKQSSKEKAKPEQIDTSSPISPSDADKSFVWKGTVDGRDQDREDGDTFEWRGTSYVVKNGYATSVCDCYSIYHAFFY